MAGMAFFAQPCPSWAHGHCGAGYLAHWSLALGGTYGLPSLLRDEAHPRSGAGWFPCHDRAAGRASGFEAGCQPVCLPVRQLEHGRVSGLGQRRHPFVAFAINVVALFARLRLVVGQLYAELLQQRELQPVSVSQVVPR